LLGQHPLYHRVFIFNGLGTKGASLGPFWAHHMADFLINHTPLDPAVDIKRFDMG
jgi:glycine/D-amino acid oxidase-like deaminating enzyme